MMRFSSNGVPAKRTGAGLNSAIDGPWKPNEKNSSAKIPATTTMARRTTRTMLRASRAGERALAFRAFSDIGALEARRSRGG